MKARIARTLFPKGCAYWMRQRIREHFTIFPQMDNIVAREKVTVLDWTWSDCFYDSDRTRVPDSAATIMLGLPNHEVDGAQAAIGALHSWLPKIDLYILHPREREWSTSSKCVRFKSPAEAILVTLAAKSKIRVYHFNSTVSFSLKEHPGIDFVRLERGTVAN